MDVKRDNFSLINDFKQNNSVGNNFIRYTMKYFRK